MRFRLAAPSCVIPDRVGPNCRALSPLVGEVALMLLETAGCLDYDQRDLPADLPTLNLAYHAHLPLDLPWSDGPRPWPRPFPGLSKKLPFSSHAVMCSILQRPDSLSGCSGSARTWPPCFGLKTRARAT
jgi:hypothetical protein